MYGDTFFFLDEGESEVESSVFLGEDVLLFTFQPEATAVELDSPELLELVETGVAVGGGSGTSKYTHSQTTPSSTWTVVHNLNTVRTPQVVLDSAPSEIVYTDVEIIDLNTLALSFDSPVTGKAYL